MIKTLTIGLATFALAVAGAANSYQVKFFEPVVLNGTTVKPGEYKVEINNNKAVLMHGKDHVAEAPVKVQSNDAKYWNTTVHLTGKQVDEIQIGGTRTRLIFEGTGVATN